MTNLTAASIKPTGTSTTRSLGDLFADLCLNVKSFGAVGDNSHDDTTVIQACLNAAYGTSGSPHGSSANLNYAVFFPAGTYKITSPLTLTSVRGAHVFGAGRLATTIVNSAGGSVFVTDGCQFSKFELMGLETSSTGICFDLDWGGTGLSLQSNTFSDMYFTAGACGLRIGATGNMGSESLISNCYFANQTTAGLSVNNQNALQQTVIGGNFAGCQKGIYVGGGSVAAVIGTGFQNNIDADIEIDNSAGDMYAIHGCRNENSRTNSTFLVLHSGASAHVSGCSHLATGSGTVTFAFVEAGSSTTGAGTLTVDSCWSPKGIFTGNGYLYLRGNPGTHLAFPNVNYLASFTGTVAQNI